MSRRKTAEEDMQSYTRRNAVGMTSCATPAEKRLRMIVVGASGVGKTQLVSVFLDRPFTPTYLPTAEEFHRSKYIIRGRTYQLDILDTAGHILSPVMQNLTILTGDLFVVVYSVADRGSWERAKDLVILIEEVTKDPVRTNKCIGRSFKNLLYPNGATTYQSDKFANGIQPKSPKNMAPLPIILAGNKSDLENMKVQSYEVSEWLRQKPTNPTSVVSHINCSAKTRYNVQQLYDRLFSLACLPCELSPNMHRKVSEVVYSSTRSTKVTPDKLNPCWDPRPKSSEGEFRFRRRSSSKRTSHLRVVPGSRSSGSSLADSSSENEDRLSPEPGESGCAIATVCINQRRPSVDTEVLLAFTKVRSYSPESQRRKTNDKTASSTVNKIRKHFTKLKVAASK